jgi:tetratricopeptide (TPR) repeat protein
LRLVPWVVVSAAYLVLRSVALGSLAPETSSVGLSSWEYLLTAGALLGRFLRALVFPTELNFWHVFAPVRSLWTVEAAAALSTVGIWAALLVWAIRRWALVPTVALTFAVLPLTPTLMLASLNQGLENAFAERYLYLPSFGAVLLAGWGIAVLYPERSRVARALTAALAALGIFGAAVTVQRNPVWKNSLSLWGDSIAKSPGSGVVNLNYGFALMGAGQAESGRSYVDRAVALTPDLVQRQMRRAISYARSGRSTDAVLAFNNVLAMDPRSAQAHYNLGVLYEGRGEDSSAVREYLSAIELDPAAADAHNNVGILLFAAGYRDQALQHLEEAVRLQPKDPAFRANLERAKSR